MKVTRKHFERTICILWRNDTDLLNDYRHWDYVADSLWGFLILTERSGVNDQLYSDVNLLRSIAREHCTIALESA